MLLTDRLKEREAKKKMIAKIEHKINLSSDIDHNQAEVDRLRALGDKEKDHKIKAHIYSEARKGEFIISNQVTERMRLSVNNISRELNIPDYVVRYRQQVMMREAA